MRSADVQQLGMFSYVSVEGRVPVEHPIRKLRALVDTILKDMDAVFAARYAARGGRQFRLSVCCVRRFCRSCTACVANAC